MGQARLRVISKGQRPSEEFTPATPVLEDHYLDLESIRTLCVTLRSTLR